MCLDCLDQVQSYSNDDVMAQGQYLFIAGNICKIVQQIPASSIFSLYGSPQDHLLELVLIGEQDQSKSILIY